MVASAAVTPPRRTWPASPPSARGFSSESDPSQADRDRYGRWLRYVARKGLDVGREQIRRGMALTYVYRNDPFRRTHEYQRTEKIAHDLLRGSWDLCW